MATYFSVKDGSLSLDTINNSFGASVSSFEVSNPNTINTSLSTSYQTSPTFVVDRNYNLSYVAFNTSSRSSSPSGTLDLNVTEISNNYTFTDNSPNKLNLLRMGSPVNTIYTPYYPNGWSGYFNGSLSTYLKTSSANSSLAFGTGDFTVEMWVYPNDNTVNYPTFLEIGSHAASTGIAFYQREISGNIPVIYSGGWYKPTNTQSLSSNRWNHLVFQRNSGNLKIFVNGIGSDDLSFSNNLTNNTNCSIGYGAGYNGGANYYYNGYISNLRIVKGQALYTTNFTPPTASFGLIDNGGAIGATATPLLSNVSLLTLQDNKFKDKSTNNFNLSSIAVNLKQTNPFVSLYTPSIHSGSTYFSSNNYISLQSPSGSITDISIGDFTAECWVYHNTFNTGANAYNSLFSRNEIIGDARGIIMYLAGGQLTFRYSTTAGSWAGFIASTITPILTGVWHHVAITRDSTKFTLWYDGINVGTSNISNATVLYNVSQQWDIGNTSSGAALNRTVPLDGYISNFRVVKGQALYTTNFTPPTAILGITDNGGANPSVVPLSSNVVMLINNNKLINSVTYSTTQSYPISSFSSSDDWSLLKLNTTLSANNNESLFLNVKTSQPNQLALKSSTSPTLTALDDTRNNSVSSFSNAITLSSVTIGGTSTNAFFLSGAGNNWLTVPANQLFNFSGDFTIEFWINTSTWSADNAQVRRIISFGPNAANTLQLLFINNLDAASSILSLYTSSNILPGTSAVADGNWHHVALSRYNNTLRLFVDGGQSGSTISNSTTFSTGTAFPLSIGTYNNTNTGRLSGYISNIRILKDYAAYTQPFTVPSIQSVSATPETVFLLKDGVVNNFNRMLVNEPTNVVNKFEGAGYFNGTSFLSTAYIPSLFDWYSTDYTLEYWFYANRVVDKTVSSTIIPLVIGNSDPNSDSTLWVFGPIANRTVRLFYNASGLQNFTSSQTINLSSWNHLALVKNSNGVYIYVNGVSDPAKTILNNPGGASLYPLSIGKYGNTTVPDGTVISNLRITKGQALYTTNFTPPTSFLTLTDNGGATPSIAPLKSNVSLLILRNNTIIDNSTNNFSITSINVTVSAAGTSNYTDLYIGGLLSSTNTENRSIIADNFYLSSVSINNRGTLSFPSNDVRNFTIYGNRGMTVNSGGTLNIGSANSPVLSSTTHVIKLSNTNFIANENSNINLYGSYKVPYTYLSVDSPASTGRFIASQSLSSTWLNGDNIVLTCNTNGLSTFDSLTLSGFESPNIFRTTTNATFSHNSLSSNPYIPSISNLTRNIKLSGTSANSNVIINGGNDNIYNTEFNNVNFSVANNTLTSVNFSNNVLNTRTFGFNKSDWVGSFNGSNSFDVTHSEALNLSSSNFTIEFWVNQTTTTGNRFLFGKGDGATAAGTTFSINNFTVWDFYVASTAYSCSRPNLSTANTWNHVAIVRNGATITCYLNGSTYTGSSITLPSNTTVINSGGSNPFRIGYGNPAGLIGYLSNVRVVKGQALYTTNFIPPTGKFGLTDNGGAIGATQTPILSNVSLLTLQDPIIKDNSINNHNITNNSGAIISNNISPFISPSYINLDNNILYRNNISLSNNINIIKFNLTNNLILSNINPALNLVNLSCTDVSMSGNYVAGLSGIGTYIQNCSGSGVIGGTINFNGTRGVIISGFNPITISNIGSVSSRQDGIYIDGSVNLNNTSFFNITSNNNALDGVLLSGNNLNPLTPTIFNINNLQSNNNGDSGIEAYNIYGNLSNIIVNENRNYGIKTSIGNGPTIFDGLTSIMSVSGKSISINVAILSGFNNYETVISNAYLSTLSASTSALTANGSLLMDSVRFSEFGLDNSILSSNTNLQLLASRNLIEGSFYINNSKVGSLPVGAGLTNIYQPGNSKNIGFAYTNFNQINGYHITYTNGGQRSIDTTYSTSSLDLPSERLTPNNRNVKLRSGSIFVALNIGQSTTISVYIRKDSTYNGNDPRLMLKSNPSVGINNDIVLATLTTNDTFVLISGTSPSVTNNGVLEFYVDCDGTAGFINIDNWSAL